MKKVYRYNDVHFPITHCNRCDIEIPYESGYADKYLVCQTCIKSLQDKDLLIKQYNLWKRYLKKKSKNAIMYATAIEHNLLT